MSADERDDDPMEPDVCRECGGELGHRVTWVRRAGEMVPLHPWCANRAVRQHGVVVR